jgi:hypothetical protein
LLGNAKCAASGSMPHEERFVQCACREYKVVDRESVCVCVSERERERERERGGERERVSE